MALDKDSFSLAAFRKIHKIGKKLKGNGTSNIAGFSVKKSIRETWSRLEGSRLYEHFFVYILHPWADLHSLVFLIFRHYQVLFSQIYSVRIIPIYLLRSYQDRFVNIITTRV